VRAYVNRRVSGDSNTYWLSWVKQRFAPAGFAHALSLGCGLGYLERHAAAIGLCNRIDAIDMSEETVRGALSLAREAGLSGLRYFVADLNHPAFAPATYDAVFAMMSLHHVRNLEALFAEIARALKPGGFLVMDEYLGPSQFRWSVAQTNLMNALLSLLPGRYRRTPDGGVKSLLVPPRPEDLATKDPSEAIRSEEIIPLLDRDFVMRAKADYGGTLLQFLLADIVGNFDAEREDDRALLNLVMLFEETLNEGGVLPSDFAIVVAQKND